MKVYGIVLWHQKAPAAPNGSRQVRCIVAAKSRVEAARILGCSPHHLMTHGSVTGNEAEIAQAMSAPRVAFWSTDRYAKNVIWRRMDGRSGDQQP